MKMVINFMSENPAEFSDFYLMLLATLHYYPLSFNYLFQM